MPLIFFTVVFLQVFFLYQISIIPVSNRLTHTFFFALRHLLEIRWTACSKVIFRWISCPRRRRFFFSFYLYFFYSYRNAASSSFETNRNLSFNSFRQIHLLSKHRCQIGSYPWIGNTIKNKLECETVGYEWKIAIPRFNASNSSKSSLFCIYEMTWWIMIQHLEFCTPISIVLNLNYSPAAFRGTQSLPFSL